MLTPAWKPKNALIVRAVQEANACGKCCCADVELVKRLLRMFASREHEAVFAFYPGAAGTQFLTQYIQAGLKGVIPLYTSSVVDEVLLPQQKELALDVFGVSQWGYDMDNPANKRYVADYKAKTKTYPSMYGAQTYDAVALIDSAVKAVNGDLSKKDEMRKAMEKADFKSVRGDFKFGKNHIPVQNFYLQSAEKLSDGWAMKTGEQIAAGDADKYVDKCNMPQ